jgi:hypothetical protein
MIVVMGLIALITATVVALAGVAIESGSVRMLGSCTGRFTGSLDARGSPRALTRFAHETTALRVDRDRLTRQLAGERTPRPRGGIARPGRHPARSRSNKANVMIMFGPRERPRRRACGHLHPVHRRREVGRRNRERIALNRPGIQQDTRSKKERS